MWRNICGTTEQASAAVTLQTCTEAVVCSNADLTTDSPDSNSATSLSFRVRTLKQNFKMKAVTSPVGLFLRGDQVDIVSYEELPGTHHGGAPLWHKLCRTEIRFPFGILDLRTK